MPIFHPSEIAKWNSQITWLTHHLSVTSRMELNPRRSARWSHDDGFCLVHFLFSTSFRNKSIRCVQTLYSIPLIVIYLFFILTIFPAIIRNYRSSISTRIKIGSDAANLIQLIFTLQFLPKLTKDFTF